MGLKPSLQPSSMPAMARTDSRRPWRLRLPVLVLVLVLALLAAATPAVAADDAPASDRVRELYYGEVLYHHYQQDYFSALTHLLVAREKAHIEPGREDTELLRIGIELSYGLHENALATFDTLLERNTAAKARDAIWLSLARTWIRRGYPERAQEALQRISPRAAVEIKAERAVLNARLLIERGDDAAASALLADVQSPPVWAAYARYNRIMALQRLDRADDSDVREPRRKTAETNPELQLLRDHTEAAIGHSHLTAGRHGAAEAAFARVGAGSAASGRALLGAAAAAFERGETARAIGAWDELSGDELGRDELSRDELSRHEAAEAHEARLMAAHAQWRLGERHDASIRYRDAAAALDREIADIDATIAGIRDDSSFALLVETGAGVAGEADIGQRSAVPAVYDSSHLSSLIVDDDFHEAWNAYRSLRFLRHHLDTWAADMDIFATMLATRRHAYEQRLPQVRERLATIDTAALATETGAFHDRLAQIDQENEAFALATAREQRLAALIAGMEARLARHGDNAALAAERERLRILKGVLSWDVERDYKARLWETRKAVTALATALAQVEQGQTRLLQAQLDAPERFEGFDARIAALSERIAALRQQLIDVTGRHEKYLQALTVAELERQRARAGEHRLRARYELAALLDEMTAERADGEWRPALDAWLAFDAVAGDDARRMHALRRIADLQLALGEEALEPDERDTGIRTAIVSYQGLLNAHPDYPDIDGVLYQLARAHDNLGDTAGSLTILTRLIDAHPASPHYAEAQFRRGEMLFVQRDYAAAELAYQAVLDLAERPRFHQQTRYKHGWSLFKQGLYEEALDDFIAVLDQSLATAPAQESPTQDSQEPATQSALVDPDTLPRAERELVADTLRIVGLSFSYLDGPRSVADYLGRRAAVPYEHLIYTSLADLYLEKERYSDAAQTYAGYVERNPGHRHAAAYQIRVFEVYDQAGFAAPAFDARHAFLRDYGPRSPYWQRHDIADMPEVAAHLKQELLAMVQRSHAAAQAAAAVGDASAEQQAAAQWYRDYLAFFPDDGESPRLSFLLAELLSEMGEHEEAIERYEQSAYHYAAHPQAAEAGYAALLAYERRIATLSDAEEKAVWQDHAIVSALRFADAFPQHPEAPAILTRSAEQLFAQERYDDALAVAARVMQYTPAPADDLRRSAWTIIGHVQFERAAYEGAETAYAAALNLSLALMPAGDPAAAALAERQAAAIYQQGAALLATDAAAAAAHFLRVAQAVPAATLVETAEYDGAAALMSIGAWEQAIPVLERFRSDWPASRWQGEVTRKLSVALLESGQLVRAAEEFGRLGEQEGDAETARAALWQSAELYMRAGETEQSLQTYQRYIARHPQPLDQAIEARRRIVASYHERRDEARYRHWLNEIVTADARAGAARTDFSHESAATAALALAEPLRERYAGIRLAVPLDRNLQAKRAAMDEALKAYRRAADYGVADVTTAATFHIGEIYHELSRSLLDSQRPAGLSADELEQYDILLEEQAYPFEEEAIKLHEVNHRRIAQGQYDDWVKRSMEQLAQLLPARYGKTEIVVSAIETIH